MKRVVVVLGPTAVGKTRVSIDLAKELNTAIISGDSMLMYRRMDIGTAKPDERERQGIPHHLVDCLEPTDSFTVVDFQQQAGRLIEELNGVGQIPIIAGGTGLYVKALLENYQFSETESDTELRAQLEQLALEKGNLHLHAKLAEIDPAAAARLHPNDQRRIIRAIEVASISGQSVSQQKEPELVYDAAVIGLTMNRERLYQNINLRVDQMLAAGLVEEVAALLAEGVPLETQAMKGIGYKEIAAYLTGVVDKETAVNNLKQATRNFAKRQLTWYRKMPYIQWFEVDQYPDYDKMLIDIKGYVAGKFSL